MLLLYSERVKLSDLAWGEAIFLSWMKEVPDHGSIQVSLVWKEEACNNYTNTAYSHNNKHCILWFSALQLFKTKNNIMLVGLQYFQSSLLCRLPLKMKIFEKRSWLYNTMLKKKKKKKAL